MKKLKLTELNSQKLNERKMSMVTGGETDKGIYCGYGLSVQFSNWGETYSCSRHCNTERSEAGTYGSVYEMYYM